jgi:hypothetical protein
MAMEANRITYSAIFMAMMTGIVLALMFLPFTMMAIYAIRPPRSNVLFKKLIK